MGETAEQWRARQMELMGEAAARVPENQQALAEVVLGANLHTLSALKMDLIDQREHLVSMSAALETHGRLLEQLDKSIGVADQIEGRALEQIEALAAQVGPLETNGARTVTQRLADLEAAHALARRQRRGIRMGLWAVGVLVLLDLVWDFLAHGAAPLVLLAGAL